MPEDTINTNQHYVSQMMLRGFETAPGSEQVYVFDKQTGRKFVTSIRNVAAERGYYDLGDALTLDVGMNRADATASRIINKIRARHSLAGMPQRDREILAGFVVLQLLRTRGFQESYRHLGHAMVNAVKERGLKPPTEWDADLIAERQREEYLRLIPEFLRDFLPHLLKKDLFLFKTTHSVPFCISDNPVALHNTVNDGDGIRGTLGLAVQGIEIYLPISSALTLAYICPSVGRVYEVQQLLLQGMGGFINEDAFYYLQARDLGKAKMLKPESVRFQNSLQILNAERFVFSSRDDFEDATDMVAKDPEARFGRRVIVE
jgi:Protein of unknown function (DUF4238)